MNRKIKQKNYNKIYQNYNKNMTYCKINYNSLKIKNYQINKFI